MSEYKKGDTVFLARFQPREVQRPCPVCFGKRAVRVILGDDSIVETPCDFCTRGYEGPFGTVSCYETESRVERVIVSSVFIEDGETRTVRYHADHAVMYPENVFDNEADALLRAEVLATEYKQEVAKRSDRGRKSSVQKLSWSVGYHMREAKRDRESAERHEARAVVLRARASSRGTTATLGDGKP